MFKKKLSYMIKENGSFKIIALLIAIILWLTILGRRDFIMSKTIDIDLIVGSGRAVVSQSTEKVKVKVAGPRSALRKFLESAMTNSLTIDISDRTDGVVEFEVPIKKIELPIGVKIISVRPNVIKAHVIAKEGG